MCQPYVLAVLLFLLASLTAMGGPNDHATMDRIHAEVRTPHKVGCGDPAACRKEGGLSECFPPQWPLVDGLYPTGIHTIPTPVLGRPSSSTKATSSVTPEDALNAVRICEAEE
jgi:hypothetical protein